MVDLCTVVFEPELDILYQQARSIARYVPDVGTIYVVVNDDSNMVIDTAQWQHLSSRVRVIHRSLFGHWWHDIGWVSQQCLKLVTSALSQAPHCVVLDAKTIFVRPMPNIVRGSRLAVGTLPVYPVFEPSRQIVNSLWHIDLQRQLGPGGVPFWFEPRALRAMIADIERRTRSNFVQWFQVQGCVTEFILYSGWLEYQQGLDTVVLPNEFHACNLCHSEVGRADQKLAEMQTSHTVSIHRSAWPRLSAQQQAQYLDLLTERLA